LERITKLAYSMITIYGMNSKVGHVSFHDPQGEYGYQRPYSEKTAELIDEEVRALIQKAYDITEALLTEKKAELELVAKALLEKEILFKSDLENLIGRRPFDLIEDAVVEAEINSTGTIETPAIAEDNNSVTPASEVTSTSSEEEIKGNDANMNTTNSDAAQEDLNND
jgi:cell division protease FtsH